MDEVKSSKKKHRKWKNSTHCCIPNCNNTRLKDIEENTYHSFYRFPPKDSKQLELWLQNNRLKRGKNYQPKSWERICSSHFEGGKLLCNCKWIKCHYDTTLSFSVIWHTYVKYKSWILILVRVILQQFEH